MEKYFTIIHEIIPEFKAEDTKLPFVAAAIDSIDLVTIRVEFEREIGKTIPDSQWMTFNKISDIIEYCQIQENKSFLKLQNKAEKGISREITIDMPQMAIEALSENWLFKELGQLHWQMLCDGLNTPSADLKDELGNRLYATFVRINIQSNAALNEFKENEKLFIDGKINRYGNSMYYSNISLKSQDAIINANLMTSFSIRNNADNTKMVKSQPNGLMNSIEEFDSMPLFGKEYRLLKKKELKEIKINKIHFKIQNDFIYETVYNINPYYDLNGVGLLYFASYPVINDVCEAGYFNTLGNTNGRWELNYYSISRDIFYFANTNIADEIIYRLHSFEFFESNRVKINSSLHRKSDGVMITRVFAVKCKKV